MITLEHFKHFDSLKNSADEIPDEKGVYLFLLKSGARLPSVDCFYNCQKLNGREIIYVGISNRSLRRRDFKQHFYGNAGASTLRKSIGSLMGLQKIPRSKTRIDGKTKFTIEDELILTEWMISNLDFCYLTTEDTNAMEALLIKKFNPPLNLSKNYNLENSVYRKLLTALRKKSN